ncbi:hypothetical protein KY330_03110 [Candidatus Woesearchaeota archaeon]|nr:hypothetical protein [Candidatus Woesearchaeota archaeon]
MKITIDTKQDSKDDIKRLINMLSHLVDNTASNTEFNTPQEQGFFNMFGSVEETKKGPDEDKSDTKEIPRIMEY